MVKNLGLMSQSMFEFPADGNLSTIGPALLYVNVEWCGHCKAARPVMNKVAGVLGTVVPVFSVDGDARKDVGRALGVSSYPTIIYIDEKGQRFEYEGERTVDALSSFVCHNSSSRHQFCKRL